MCTVDVSSELEIAFLASGDGVSSANLNLC